MEPFYSIVNLPKRGTRLLTGGGAAGKIAKHEKNSLDFVYDSNDGSEWICRQ